MFAGLPGIGVGTLFYIVMTLCMPVLEIRHVMRGTSSLARWQQIIRQWCFSVAIILSIMIAERVLMAVFTGGGPRSLSPARLLNQELSSRAPQSFFAAPMTASLLLLAAVLVLVEISRIIQNVRHSSETQPGMLDAHHRTSALSEPIEQSEPELVAD
jgi:hypothetical protein